MNMFASSKDITTLNEHTLAILKKAKGAKKTLSLDDVKGLISEYETLGKELFFKMAEEFIAAKPAKKSKPTGTTSDDFERKIKKFSQSFAGETKVFISEILNEAKGQASYKISSPKPTSIPKLVQSFRLDSSEHELLRLAELVTERNSRSHAPFRAKPLG